MRMTTDGQNAGFVVERPYPFIIPLSMNYWVVVLHKQHPSYFQEELLHGYATQLTGIPFLYTAASPAIYGKFL